MSAAHIQGGGKWLQKDELMIPLQWRCGELPSWETMPACPGCALGPACGSLWPFAPFAGRYFSPPLQLRLVMSGSFLPGTCMRPLRPLWAMHFSGHRCAHVPFSLFFPRTRLLLCYPLLLGLLLMLINSSFIRKNLLC